MLRVCSAESQEGLQPFLLPQQRPGELSAKVARRAADTKQAPVLIRCCFQEMSSWVYGCVQKNGSSW